MENSIYFFKQVRKIRDHKSITQSDIANALNIGPSAYCKLENGTSEPTLEQAYSIAQVIQTTIVKLLSQGNFTNQHNENNTNCTVISIVENLNLTVQKAEELVKNLQDFISVSKK